MSEWRDANHTGSHVTPQWIKQLIRCPRLGNISASKSTVWKTVDMPDRRVTGLYYTRYGITFSTRFGVLAAYLSSPSISYTLAVSEAE